MQAVLIPVLSQQRRQALRGLDLAVIRVIAKQHDMAYAALMNISQCRVQCSCTFIEYPRCPACVGPASQSAGLAIKGCCTEVIVTVDVMEMGICDDSNDRQLTGSGNRYLTDWVDWLHGQGYDREVGKPSVYPKTRQAPIFRHERVAGRSFCRIEDS